MKTLELKYRPGKNARRMKGGKEKCPRHDPPDKPLSRWHEACWNDNMKNQILKEVNGNGK